jgi:hypothetical protein
MYLKKALDVIKCQGLLEFSLTFLVHIHWENILKLFQRYDTNGLDLKEFMDEVGLNMV